MNSARSFYKFLIFLVFLFIFLVFLPQEVFAGCQRTARWCPWDAPPECECVQFYVDRLECWKIASNCLERFVCTLDSTPCGGGGVHMECQAGKCVQVAGGGPSQDECGWQAPLGWNAPCRECVGGQCVGRDYKVSPGKRCTRNKHCRKCVRGACVGQSRTVSDTSLQCTRNKDCAAPTPTPTPTPVTHKECQNGRCVEVSGAGTDECSADKQCNRCNKGICEPRNAPVADSSRWCTPGKNRQCRECTEVCTASGYYKCAYRSYRVAADKRCLKDSGCGSCGTPTPTPTPTPVEMGEVTGSVFEDLNKNGIKDPGEKCFQGAVNIWIDGVKHEFWSTTACNTYSYQIQKGMTHSIFIYPIPSGYTATGWSGTCGGKHCSGRGSSAMFSESKINFGLASLQEPYEEPRLSFFSRTYYFLIQRLRSLLRIFR